MLRTIWVLEGTFDSVRVRLARVRRPCPGWYGPLVRSRCCGSDFLVRHGRAGQGRPHLLFALRSSGVFSLAPATFLKRVSERPVFRAIAWSSVTSHRQWGW